MISHKYFKVLFLLLGAVACGDDSKDNAKEEESYTIEGKFLLSCEYDVYSFCHNFYGTGYKDTTISAQDLCTMKEDGTINQEFLAVLTAASKTEKCSTENLLGTCFWVDGAIEVETLDYKGLLTLSEAKIRCEEDLNGIFVEPK